MRELARLKSLREYSHALVRVRLPGGILVQACFHPQEPGARPRPAPFPRLTQATWLIPSAAYPCLPPLLTGAPLLPRAWPSPHPCLTTPTFAHTLALPAVSHVLELVTSCLVDELATRPCHLFTTPPRTVLKPSASLVEQGLAPAATAILAWDQTLPTELAA